MVNISLNEKSKKDYVIPVVWKSREYVSVKANSLKEAYDFVENHIIQLPLGKEVENLDLTREIECDLDNCTPLQEDVVVCTAFNCKDDLSDYKDSMLFDSGELVASAKFAYFDKTLSIDLRVCGYVSVNYKGENYRHFSDFPEELKQIAREGKLYEDSDVYVWENNWFEYLYDSDGDVEESDISKMTPEEILESMTYLAEEYFKNLKDAA